jgi:hypothetical protein
MAKFSRRSAFKLVGGLFAFIPVVKYLADTAPAHADANPIPIPGCSSCEVVQTFCQPSSTGSGQNTIWSLYLCFGCPTPPNSRPQPVQSVAIDTGVPCPAAS